MKSTHTTLHRLFYPAYREIWRGWIFIFILLVLTISAHSAHLGHNFIPYPLFSLMFFPFTLAWEYTHPRPTELGFSNPSTAKFAFTFVALLAPIVWLTLYHNNLDQWLWLIFTWVAIFLA